MCSASLVSLVDPAMALHMKNTSVVFSMSNGFFFFWGVMGSPESGVFSRIGSALCLFV